MSKESKDELLEFARKGSFSYKQNFPLMSSQLSNDSNPEMVNEAFKLPARRMSEPKVSGPEFPSMSPRLFSASESEEEEEEIRLSKMLPPRQPRRSSDADVRSTATSVGRASSIDLRMLEPLSPERFHKAELPSRSARSDSDRLSPSRDNRMSIRNKPVPRTRSRSSSPARRESGGGNPPSLLPIETNDVDDVESEILFTRARTLNTMNGNHSSAKIMTTKATPMTMTPRLVAAQKRAMEKMQGSSQEHGSQRISYR